MESRPNVGRARPSGSKVTSQVPGWAAQGFTALWLPPANKGFGGEKTVGYDVYDLWDLGRYRAHNAERTKHGTFDDVQSLIGACRSARVQAYADLVFNHKMGATQQESVRVQHVDKDNKNQPLGDWHWRDLHTHFRFGDRFDVQGWGGAPTNSYFEWKADHFDAVELNIDGQNYTFRLKAKTFESDSSDEHGRPPYLMGCDVDTSHPDVYDELCRIGEWMLGGLGFDGFRLDAVKHMRTTFFRDFLKRMSHSQARKVFAVGEYWSDDVGQLHHYLNRCDSEMALFDVPLQKHFHDASKAPDGAYDMGGILQHTLMLERPTHAVTFVQNHDTMPLRSLEQVVESWFVPLAYAIILLREQGYPCVFYADMYGASYADKGRDGTGWRGAREHLAAPSALPAPASHPSPRERPATHSRGRAGCHSGRCTASTDRAAPARPPFSAKMTPTTPSAGNHGRLRKAVLRPDGPAGSSSD